MFIIHHKNFFLGIAVLVTIGALFTTLRFGINQGIEFTGGTSAQVVFGSPATGTVAAIPTAEQVRAKLSAGSIENMSIRQVGENGFDIRVRTGTTEESDVFVGKVSTAVTTWDAFYGKIESVTQIGPSIGLELRRKSTWAIAFVLLAIVLYIAYVFRGVGKTVSSWMYGGVTVVGLIHDIIVAMGAFAFLSYVTGAQADTLFVTALLAILGFSVSNTIVVLDRVRENLQGKNDKHTHEHFATIVGESVSQTFVRSMNTSITTALALAAVYFIGPETTKDFSFVLLVGVIAGAFSSLFIAPTLLVTLAQRAQKK